VPLPPCFRRVVKGVARRRLQSLRVCGKSYYRLDSSVRTARRTSTPRRSSLASGRSRRSSTPSTIHEHDRDLPNPIRPHLEVALAMRLLGGKPLSGPDQLGFLGSGARIRLSPVRAPPAAIARTEVGYPDPRDPDTFCRELVIEMAGEAIPLRCTKRAPSTNPPGEAACAKPAPGDPTFAGPSGRAASCSPPRRGARLAKPKVPSVVGGALGGWGPARRTEPDP